MAIQTITYEALTWVPLVPCQQVRICLPSEWAEKTVSGEAFAVATVENTQRHLGVQCNPFKFNVRGNGVAQYTLNVDDSQFLVDEVTDLPYQLSCEEVLEVFPYNCTATNIIGLIPEPEEPEERVETEPDPEV